MSEFHDPDLRQELARLSGPYPDDNAAFAAWQRRVGQVRRRRVVTWTATAALALVVGTVAVAAVQSPRRHTVVPGKAADSSVDVNITSSEAEESSTVPEETEAESSPPATSTTETAPSLAGASVPATEAPEAAGAPSNGSSSSGHSGTQSMPAPQETQLLTQTFSSVGGSITVRKEGDRLTVIAENPAPGFKAKNTDRSGEKVEVTFESRDHTSEITVKLDDGVMNPYFKESNDDGHHDDSSSVPRTSEADHGEKDGNGED